ncbi:MAG TPA: ATP-binding protein [Burkholderiaceae bacterium]|nr:ATP-binding protein [Burkholderiaceae bacterium]
MYSDAELEAMLSSLESDLVERKESFSGDAPSKVRQAVCAFANDLPNHGTPGVVFVGAKDDGTPSGLPITDELLQKLAHIRDDGKTLPLPTITVQRRVLLGQPIAVICVTPSDAPPVRYEGRTWIRVGPRRALASRQEERELNERRRAKDLPFDLEPLRFAKITDLNRLLFEQTYLATAFAADVIQANERTYEERLISCRMVDPDAQHPTVVGALTLGIDPLDLVPCAYVQFLRIAGTELADPIIDEARLTGPLPDLIRRIDEKLQAHINVGVDLVTSDTERRKPTYPLAALQQLVRNAVMHRTYESTNAPIRVTWFDDRIEIFNPGGPYGIVTKANFGQPGRTDYRNPNIAEVLRNLSYVQQFGVGIATARRLLSSNGHPELLFDLSDPNGVMAIVRCA